MMGMRIVLAGAVAAVALSAVPASLQAADAGKLETTAISVPTKAAGFLPILVGIDKGIYREAGLDLQVKVMRPNIGIAAAISGEVPFAGAMNSSLNSAIVGQSQMKLLVVLFKDQFISLVASPKIKTVQELKGGTVMISGGINASNGQALVAIMKAVGMDARKDVNIVSSTDNGPILQALIAGAIQGAIFPPPYPQQAVASGFHVLKDARDVVKRPYGAISVNAPYLQTNAGTARKMVAGTLRSIRYVIDNRAETVAWMAANMNLEPKIADGVYLDVTKSLAADGRMSREALTEHFEEMKAAAKSDKPIAFENLVDFSLVDSVMRDGGR